jgi:tRNA-specific 2-thiouridylase
MQKTDVRLLAHRYGLLVADKPDSQDICFVPSGKYSDFIERIWPEAAVPGAIVHIDGRVLGNHAGVIHYTIGQRRGLGLSAHGAAAGEPLYVVKLDAAKAQVVVGPRAALATRRVRLRELNWVGDGTLDDLARDGRDLFVRVRSTRPPVPGFLHLDGDDAYVDFATDEDGVAPGQACVFYASDLTDARVLGGGFISATEPAAQMSRGDAAGASLVTSGRH